MSKTSNGTATTSLIMSPRLHACHNKFVIELGSIMNFFIFSFTSNSFHRTCAQLSSEFSVPNVLLIMLCKLPAPCTNAARRWAREADHTSRSLKATMTLVACEVSESLPSSWGVSEQLWKAALSSELRLDKHSESHFSGQEPGRRKLAVDSEDMLDMRRECDKRLETGFSILSELTEPRRAEERRQR